MLTVPEGVCLCVQCCRVGLAVFALSTDEASCSCSAVIYSKIPQFDVWLLIVCGTRSHCGVSLVTDTSFVLSSTWALRDSLLSAQWLPLEPSLKRILIGLWARSALELLEVSCIRCFRLSSAVQYPGGQQRPYTHCRRFERGREVHHRWIRPGDIMTVAGLPPPRVCRAHANRTEKAEVNFIS